MAQMKDHEEQPTMEGVLKTAKERARQMSAGSRRVDIPVRARFIRDVDAKTGGTANTPMKRLVAAGSRDGITLRLYLALLWRCSAPPYNTEIPARLWAELLALEPPMETYSRRISSAVKRLEDAGLIAVERVKGQPSVITLLDESGDGTPYSPPRGGRAPLDRWVKVPIGLWQNDDFYGLGTPGLAMLLAVLAERNAADEAMWWSVKRFQQRIGLTPSTRARGLKQLREARLLTVGREKLASNPGRFSKDPVRHTYLLHLDGLPPPRKKSKVGHVVKQNN